MSAPLFTETVENWKDWGRVFQSIPAFTPLAQEICRREGLPWVGLSPLTPGTNGVFRCGDAVLKIFFPKESGLDPALDFHRELAVSQWAARRGSPPRGAGPGMVSDKYDFYYLVTQYCPGEEAGPWLEEATPPSSGLWWRVCGVCWPARTGPRRGSSPGGPEGPGSDKQAPGKLTPSLGGRSVLHRLEGMELGEIVLTHGDLTGENLLVKEDGSLVVIDWADARLAPAWYELGPIAFELFQGRGELLRLFAGEDREAFIERLLDCCCLHDFGADFLWNFWQQEGAAEFQSLAEVRGLLEEKLGRDK